MTTLRVITNSERSRFACEREWAYRYLDGLSRDLEAAPLRTGGLWHDCQQYLYEGALWQGSNLDAHALTYRDVIAPWIEKQAERVSEAEPEIAERWNRETVEQAGLVTALLRGYLHVWGDSDRETFEVIAVEPQFARALTHPGTGVQIEDVVKVKDKLLRRPWFYGGGADRILRDKRTGLLWLLELKTTAARDLQRYLTKLDVDQQTRGYAWALRGVTTGDVPSMEVAGVIYDVVRKKVPTVPKVLKSGKISKDKRIDTTRDVYETAVVAAGQDPAEYADFTETLPGWESFFARTHLPFSETDLVDFHADAYATALLIKDAQERDYHPRQVAVCQGGAAPRGCTFSEICQPGCDTPQARAMSYRVQGIRHAELRGDLAEPYVAKTRNLTLGFDGSPGNHPKEEVSFFDEESDQW